MKILHLAAGNRWTGAAAPAFAEVEALRAAGVDAHYAYVGGYKLEAKLHTHDFAHPIIQKAQNPWSFLRTKAAIERMIDQHGFDILHTHLTYDHWLARFVSGGHRIRVARTFHSRRVLRSDPFTRSLVARTGALFVINEAFTSAPLLAGRDVWFTPPPLDLRQFTREGPDVRSVYGFGDEEPVIAAIGKLSAGRGFEAVMETFALMRKESPAARLMIIGHGEHRPALEAYARALGIDRVLTWAGYHEDDLAEHYRSADLLLFTARGSDEGHRAILEAMACGLPPLCYPLEGISALAGDLTSSLVAAEVAPEALAARALQSLGDAQLRRAVVDRAEAFGYRAAADRLLHAYESTR